MTETNKITEFITFPKTFEKYRWYKPILVFIIGLILMLIFQLILLVVFGAIYGESAMDIITGGGYEVLNTNLGEIFTDLSVIVMIPALYIATKIVRDRPNTVFDCKLNFSASSMYRRGICIPWPNHANLRIMVQNTSFSNSASGHNIFSFPWI